MTRIRSSAVQNAIAHPKLAVHCVDVASTSVFDVVRPFALYMVASGLDLALRLFCWLPLAPFFFPNA